MRLQVKVWSLAVAEGSGGGGGTQLFNIGRIKVQNLCHVWDHWL